MKNGLLNVLKGKFLVSEAAPKNWSFIVFVSVLATIMIGSSHSADKKVHHIAAMNEQVRELRSQFLDLHKEVQQMKLESKISQTMIAKNIYPSEHPPRKIKVKSITP